MWSHTHSRVSSDPHTQIMAFTDFGPFLCLYMCRCWWRPFLHWGLNVGGLRVTSIPLRMRWQLPWQREVRVPFIQSLSHFLTSFLPLSSALFNFSLSCRFLRVCLEGGVWGWFLVVHRSLRQPGGLAAQHGEREETDAGCFTYFYFIFLL